MKLVDNWKSVLLKAWTVWLAVVSAVAGLVQAIHADVVALVPVFSQFLDDGQAGVLSMVTAAMIPLARIVKQVSISIDEAAK